MKTSVLKTIYTMRNHEVTFFTVWFFNVLKCTDKNYITFNEYLLKN